MFGVLEVCLAQLRNEVYFVELSELCSANYQFSQLRTGVPCLTCLIHLLPSSEPSRDSSVVRALVSLSKGHWVLFSFFFFSFFFHFGIRSNPRVTAMARKRSRPFCQKCRWQVTAKTRMHPTYVALHEVT